MNLVLSDTQELVRDSARELFKRNPVARARALRNACIAGSDPGFARPLWLEMAGLGWLGMTVPERFGGIDLGLAELCIVLEQAGRVLAPEPLIGSALLATEAIALGGRNAQRERWLTRLVCGEAIAALAWDERGLGGDPARTRARAEPRGDGFALFGEKRDVLAGNAADVLVVSARKVGAAAGDAPELWLVDPRAPGVTLVPAARIDGQPCAHATLDGVVVSDDDRVDGSPGLLDRLIDRAAIALSAEMLGSMSAAFDRTLAYLRDRQQFGVPIGTFQALRHRAARMYVEIELVRSAVMAAARTADVPSGPPALLGQVASLAKARASDAAILVANECLQMHGGIGMTEEHDIGLFFKRARVAAHTFGDAGRHRDRWARLAGY